MLPGPYAAYASNPEFDLPVPAWRDLVRDARVDALVKEVLKRVEAAGLLGAMEMPVAADMPAMTPFDFGDDASLPFGIAPAPLPDTEPPADFFEPPDGGPLMPMETADPMAADSDTYRVMSATPFDDPFAGPFAGPVDPLSGEGAGRGLPDIPVSRKTFDPLARAVRPTFDTYSRFGYPQLQADPYGGGLINAIRRMVRGAQV